MINLTVSYRLRRAEMVYALALKIDHSGIFYKDAWYFEDPPAIDKNTARKAARDVLSYYGSGTVVNQTHDVSPKSLKWADKQIARLFPNLEN